mgnify:FL=1
MAFTKINAAGIGTTETVTVDGLTVINDGSFGGNLTVSGVLTYEDVTNVDSVGLITARNGIVVGSGITLSKDGDVFFTGIATGNGSGLTALNASNISSGTVPTARLGSGTASSSTFLRGDSTFQTVNTDLVSDTSPQLGGNLDVNTKNIVFGDSSDGSSDDVLSFGASGDLKIFHQADQSRIVESGPSVLKIMGSDVRISNAGNTADYIQCNDGSDVKLYHNGSIRLETTSTGVSITSKLTLPDGAGNGIRIGDSSDLQAYHDGSASWIYENGTGPLNIGSNNSNVKIMGGNSASDTMAEFKSTEGVELYYNNVKTFETSSEGIIVQGTENGGGVIGLYADEGDDNADKWQLVSENNGTFQIKNYTSGSWENVLQATGDGAVELYYDNTKRFHTTSTGAYITGDLTLTSNLVMGNSDEIKLGSSSQMTIWHSGSDFTMYNSAGQLIISNASGTGTGEGEIVFKSGNNNTRWRILSGGDLIPASNNSFTVGSSSNRVAVFYSNTSLNTSDRNEKNTIIESDLGLDFVNQLKPVSYKWNQKEGEILDTKTHYGLIAQDIEETVLTEGKKITDFGFIDKPKEGQMSLAYNELISPLIKAVQELSAKNEALEARIKTLEG